MQICYLSRNWMEQSLPLNMLWGSGQSWTCLGLDPTSLCYFLGD